MKNIVKLLAVIFLIVTFIGCDVNDTIYEVDTIPPIPPTGVQVINGDNRVDLYWIDNRESDLAGYNVYYSDSYDGKYYLIDSSPINYFVDNAALNGEKYFYAVTAYDYNGNESDLSVDVVYATARPEGFNQSIFDYRQFPGNSGYDFSDYSVVPFNSQEADFFFEIFDGDFYLDVYSDTDIQDMGPTNDIYDIPFAPATGWSPTKDAFAIEGHTYVIWTWNNHYAKIRISQITNERVVFDWAYQMSEGERQLKTSVIPNERNPVEKEWLR